MQVKFNSNIAFNGRKTVWANRLYTISSDFFENSHKNSFNEYGIEALTKMHSKEKSFITDDYYDRELLKRLTNDISEGRMEFIKIEGEKPYDRFYFMNNNTIEDLEITPKNVSVVLTKHKRDIVNGAFKLYKASEEFIGECFSTPEVIKEVGDFCQIIEKSFKK